MRNFNRLVRIPFVFAALWSIGASIYLLLKPIAIHQEIAVSSPGSLATVKEVIGQSSWYEVQGIWGVIVLIIFSIIFTSIGFFAIRNRFIAIAGTSLLAVILTYLAGFSIGPLYLPAILAVAAGWATLGLTRIIRARERKSG